MWVAEHEADVASDLSAFHRVDDPMTLDGPRYFSLAMRLGAYAGVVAARIYDERHADDEPSAPRGGRSERVDVSDDVALAMLADDPMFAPERAYESEPA
jgi:hypothetical protein